MDARVVETHSAVLVFVEDRVFKVKKPVRFAFCDFRTREAREQACHQEVELNRRLAPDVYLGVFDVLGPDGRPCDHLVGMRRMPDAARLATLVRHRMATVQHMRDVARVVAAFHASVPPTPEAAAAASYEHVTGLWWSGLDQLAAQRPVVVDPAVVTATRALAERYFAGRRVLLDERVAQGCARDGHGDLLADDIFVLPDGPRILDCLEFDPALRYGDVLGDVAFLAMDLEHLGAPDLARAFLDAYSEYAGETHPASLEHVYIAYRAHVRAKVSALRAAQGDMTAAGVARALAELTRDHLVAAQVRLVVVGGLPATGKSTTAAALADEHGAVLLRSDVVRKELAGLPATAPAAAAMDEGLYRPDLRAAVYAELLRRATVALQRGESVVLDASWADPGQRAATRSVAANCSADLTELECTAPADVARARLAARSGDASDATVEVYDAMAAQWVPWPEATQVPTHADPVPAG